MASRLRVDEILPSVGNNIAIGTATGSVSFANATYTVGTGASVSSPATNVLALGTNDAERVRIDSSGNVGIGTDNPLYKLDVLEGSSNVARFSRTGGQWAKVNITAGLVGGNSYITFGDPDEGESGAINYEHTDDSLRFETWNGTSKVERLRITTNGDTQVAAGSSLYLANGNLVFSTAGTGIDFSATADGGTTTPNELLDDYEEGTWTPAFTGLTSPTYTTQDGVYTKVGNLIYCECRVKLSNTGTASGGALQISGFPYNSSSSLVSRLGAYSINYITITGQDEGTLEASYLGSSTAVFNILENGHVSVLNTALTNTSQVDLMIVYRTL